MFRNLWYAYAMRHAAGIVALLALAGCAAPETKIQPAESSVIHTRNETRPVTRTRTTRTVRVDPPVIQLGTSLENAK